ncbi:hypothetical protein CEP51_013616 [Fusarium floridanum]|uniref:MalT-like TPR region domain-containing protein n=1 Tax=Fusarium floridanum TaxID=1325733 RepID=A0A428Q8C4_9HYPO|nr:hypothetical protein CEP51_013616 [Fusarium floridanum]
MAHADQAGIVRLALNSSLYPPRDEPLPEGSPVVADNVNNLPYLPEQAWELARLIYYAGNNVPSFFFSTQKVSWSEDGEIDIRKIHSSLPLGFLDELERFQLLHVRQSSGQETYSLCKLISDEIPPSTSIKEAGQWRMRALKHVFDIFPQTGETEPITYTQKGDSLVPILRKLSSYMWSDATQGSDTEFLAAAFKGFLAATNFGDFTWKIQAIQVAERLSLLTNNYVDISRVSLRHYALRRLDPLRRKQPVPSLPLTISHLQAANKRDNAFMGQFTLMKTQALMDEGASPSDVYEATRTFQVLDPNEISRQEDLVLLQCRFLYAKSLRYDGRFEQAAEFFNQVLDTAKQLKSRLMLKVVIQYAELESERGNHAVALQFLNQDKEYLSSARRTELGSGRRLTLALAYAHLMKALDDMIRIGHRDDVALNEAAGLFQWIQNAYTSMGQVSLTLTQSIFQACCGLAMIYHIRQETAQAYHWWEEAKVAANRRWPEPGYAIMIVAYSQSQLAFQLGRADAVELSQQAKQVWDSIGRRRYYHFTGLGTLWPDCIGYHEEQQSRQRLIPLHQQG